MAAIEKVAIAIEKCKGKDGYTLIEHLTEIIDKIMLNPKDYPLEKIEELSYLIKLTRLQPPQLLPDTEVKRLSRHISPTQQWLQHYLQTISTV